ncbi:MAG TPA: NlpC/P60 family protein, partial [Streptomyces sp.]
PAADAQPCQASIGPWPSGGQGDGAGQAARLDPEQRGIAAQIMTIGHQRNLSPRAWQIALQAGMTESRLHNLHYGDADSQGIFQMRPSMNWGTVEQVTDPTYAINKFYDVLLTVPGWEEMRPGDAAQRVERSGFPDRYHAWEAMAAFLISQQGVPDPTGCSSPTVADGTAAQAAIEAAKSQLGQPYAWGGGNASGPTRGIRDGGVADRFGDYNKIGFDCSGLMLYAYAHAGITLPRQSSDQYGAGKHVPFAEAKPGDLVFRATNPSDPRTIYHVGMYLGDNKVLQAPQSGDVVKISDMWTKDMVPDVTRPGA